MTAKRVRRKAIVIPITEGRRPPDPHSPILVTGGLGRQGIEIRARVVPSNVAGWVDRLQRPREPRPEPIVFLPPDHPLAGDAHPMKYVISEDNKVRVCPAGFGRPKDAALAFSDYPELCTLAADWPLQRLVRVWNQLPGTRAVTRFENRLVALDRIWAAIEKVREELAAARPAVARKPAARETKTDLIVRMLRARNGATLAALTEVTGWQAHSMRGFLSARLGKELGLKVQSAVREGERVYRITGRPPAKY